MSTQVRTEAPGTYGADIQPKHPGARLGAKCKASDDEVIARAIGILTSRLRRQGAMVRSPADVENLLRLSLAEEKSELFGILWLDTPGGLLANQVMFRGSLGSCSVYSREVVKAALVQNAASAVLYHNHPSGITTPSCDDVAMTARLIDCLALVGVTVHDHLICGGALTGDASVPHVLSMREYDMGRYWRMVERWRADEPGDRQTIKSILG